MAKMRARKSLPDLTGLPPEQARERLLSVVRGARDRDLAARHLLLHPEDIAGASVHDLWALKDYLACETWKGLCGHDRPMYRLLRAGVPRAQDELRKRMRRMIEENTAEVQQKSPNAKTRKLFREVR